MESQTMPVSEKAVLESTGLDWNGWFAALDGDGAATLKHGEIVKAVQRLRPEVSGWWAQTVTVGYERARGLRAAHQTTEGFRISASRTVDVDQEALFAAWADDDRRARWLDGVELAVSSTKAPKSLRGATADGARLDVYISARKDRAQVALEERKLPDAAAVERRRAVWKAVLDRMKADLEG